MRLFMTADTVGGVWSYALSLASGLRALGVETTLATLGPAAAPDQRDAAAMAGLTLIETGLDMDWLASAEDLAYGAPRLADLARQHAPDVVQLNSPSLAALATFSAPVVGACHSCLASWWQTVRGTAVMPPDFQWRTALLARGYAACDTLVAPSDAFAATTQALYGVKPTVVPNATPAAPALPQTPRHGILTAGRLWDEAKNFAALDEAAGLLDLPLAAAGPLQLENGGSVISHHAVALGRLSTVALQDRMRRAAVFASLAFYEPFGLSVLEAAANGCALVLADIPSFREIWHGAALFTPPRDSRAAGQLLRDLLASPAQITALAAAARDRAATYTIAAMSAAMLQLYRRLCEKSAVAA